MDSRNEKTVKLTRLSGFLGGGVAVVIFEEEE